jgi:hypothetical protein
MVCKRLPLDDIEDDVPLVPTMNFLVLLFEEDRAHLRGKDRDDQAASPDDGLFAYMSDVS